jgi:hypothetical protein
LVDPDEHDFDTMQQARSLFNENQDGISNENIDEVKNTAFRLLGEFSVNYSKDDWQERFEQNDVGVRGILEVVFEMVDQVEDRLEAKKKR